MICFPPRPSFHSPTINALATFPFCLFFSSLLHTPLGQGYSDFFFFAMLPIIGQAGVLMGQEGNEGCLLIDYENKQDMNY